MADGERSSVRKGPLGVVAATTLLAAAGGALVLTGGMPGCDEQAARGVERVRVGGKTFFLELANTRELRTKGLSDREFIEPDGGMLFVFPEDEVGIQRFVMRDCPIDIDIIFLNANGQVVASHAMTVEAPRGEGEGQAGEISPAYENRLKKYSSRYPAQFAIELKGGTLSKLDVKDGEVIHLDLDRLKDEAR